MIQMVWDDFDLFSYLFLNENRIHPELSKVSQQIVGSCTWTYKRSRQFYAISGLNKPMQV